MSELIDHGVRFLGAYEDVVAAFEKAGVVKGFAPTDEQLDTVCEELGFKDREQLRALAKQVR